jgi:alpha-ribazole phosphatase
MSGVLLHLLRHGVPEVPGLFMGRTDGAPTSAGIAACVDRVAGLEVGAIVSSGLVRCDRAAGAIGAKLTLGFTIDPRWRELDFGEWDGKAPGDIDQEALRRFWNAPDVNPPRGGERWSSLVARITTAIQDIAHGPTLVVTHAGAMRAALSVLCRFEFGQCWALDLPCASLLSFRLWPGEQLSGQIVGLRT